MEQEQRITYRAGITRTPSDFLCGDGELAECINLTTDSEELKPVVQPRLKMTTNIGAQVQYIHRFNGSKRYIYLSYHTPAREDPEKNNAFVNWAENVNGTLTFRGRFDVNVNSYYVSFTSIGKTLIVNTQRGIRYFLWKGDTYTDLGQLPSPDVKFFLKASATPAREFLVTNSGERGECMKESGQPVDGKVEEYNDLLVGLYAKNKKAVAQKKCFCEPFFVRCAIELYDGTYTHITQPILLFPTITSNSCLVINGGDVNMHTVCCQLWYVNNSSLGEWADIVKGITVFATDGVEIYDLSVDQPTANFGPMALNGVFSTGSANGSSYHSFKYNDGNRCLTQRDSNEILNDIKAASVFYKLCTIDKQGDSIAHNIGEKIAKHQLENIVTQERLQYDDYFSRSKLIPEFVYGYNGRLNIANTSRTFFEGFDYFMPYDNSGENTYKFYVTIKTDSGDKIVRHVANTYQKQGFYFFYPDSRAKHVMIFKNGSCICNEDLTEHPGLNGAYYLRSLPPENGDENTVSGSEPSGWEEPDPEQLDNYIITSEVNNPFVFKAEGYNKVSAGKIIGISTTTQALSQGQFGQYPLLVFSDTGIWAMSVDGTGLYQSIVPMSREVCISKKSITQTDGAVFFVSKKGLMVIAGNEVRCVSGRMNGKTFNTAELSNIASDDWSSIITTCQGNISFQNFICDEYTFLAFDYYDARILIINQSYSYCYVYDLQDGSFTKAILPETMSNAINDYPDTLLQGSATIYSLYDKPREEDVNTRQTAFMLTRPMKLAGPVSQTSLRQLKNVGTWNESAGSKVKTVVYVSEDQRTWYELQSRFGAAARYFRLALYIKMLPTERLSGTILSEQARRVKNMR